MKNKEIAKQTIDLYKKSFDDCFTAMSTLQDQTGKFLKAFVDNYPGMTDEGRKAMEQWIDLYKKNRDDFKKAIDEGYSKLELLPDYNAIVMLQDHTEKIFNTFLQSTKWMSQGTKKSMEEMVTVYKKGLDEFKDNIDKNIRNMENPFSPPDKPQTKVDQK